MISEIMLIRLVSANLIPKLSIFKQKILRLEIDQEVLNEVNDDPELLKLVQTIM